MFASSFLFIADATPSASALWPQTAKAIATLLAVLPEGASAEIYALGTRHHWPADEWGADRPSPPNALGSARFLAPIMESLRGADHPPRAIIVVGNGEVFDLADWAAEQNRWGFVQVGGDSLQGISGRWLEVAPENLEPVVQLLRHAPVALAAPRPPAPASFVRHQWQIDRAGFPLVCVEPLNAYIHLFPIAKPQFERYLAEARPADCDAAWYASLLKLNPRLSPTARSYAAYESLFLTGLLPPDVEAYARWCGPDFAPLTADEWHTALHWLAAQDPSTLPFELEQTMALMARRMWDGLLAQVQPPTLADLALMRGGVLEWVRGPEDRWLGMGQPRQEFRKGYHDVDAAIEPSLWVLTKPSRLWGARLLRRA